MAVREKELRWLGGCKRKVRRLVLGWVNYDFREAGGRKGLTHEAKLAINTFSFRRFCWKVIAVGVRADD
jgi:hypothetical protein